MAQNSIFIWFKKNIGFIISAGILFGMVTNVIPLPAKAADVDKLAASVQQLYDTQKSSTRTHSVKHLQNEISTLKMQFIVAGKDLSPEAIFYIDERQQEINNINGG